MIELTAVYERLEERGWFASCPEMPLAVAQGDTLDDARNMLKTTIENSPNNDLDRAVRRIKHQDLIVEPIWRRGGENAFTPERLLNAPGTRRARTDDGGRLIVRGYRLPRPRELPAIERKPDGTRRGGPGVAWSPRSATRRASWLQRRSSSGHRHP